MAWVFLNFRLYRPAAIALLAIVLAAATQPARALDIELGDVAPDRVERQRAYNRGAVPLPGTPDLQRLDERLAAKGLAKGNPIFIRIFKATSELELWMQKGSAWVLLDTYPICHWTGTLGPKLREGDKQSPEGFYSVTNRQMRLVGRWRRAFDLGFPNAFDHLNRRTGSHILIHGGCSSTGCFAMTEAVQDEIYGLAEAAQKNGQARFQVHVFPFRMTDESLAAHAEHPWASFWRDLKAGYDAFERTRVPPKVALSGRRYHVSEGDAPGGAADASPGSALQALRRMTATGEGDMACAVEPEREPRATIAAAPSQPHVSLKQQVHRASRVNASRSPKAAPVPEDQSLAPNGLGDRIDKGAPRIVSYGG